MTDLLKEARRFTEVEERVGSCYPRPGMVNRLVKEIERLEDKLDEVRTHWEFGTHKDTGWHNQMRDILFGCDVLVEYDDYKGSSSNEV